MTGCASAGGIEPAYQGLVGSPACGADGQVRQRARQRAMNEVSASRAQRWIAWGWAGINKTRRSLVAFLGGTIMATFFDWFKSMDIAKKLSTLRKRKGLSQQAFADCIGIHVTQVKRYEAGTALPSLEAIKKWLKL